MKLELPRLYAITDSKRYPDFLERLEKVLKKGVRMVQLREKQISGLEYYRLALKVREMTKDYGALLFINDRVDIALAVGADGVHLPEKGFPPSVVKRMAPGLLVGYSAHSLEEALYAQREGADFITLSPIFKTQSHLERKPIGLVVLRDVSQSLSIPVYALGGITWDRIKLCYKNGAYGIAGIGLFFEHVIKPWPIPAVKGREGPSGVYKDLQGSHYPPCIVGRDLFGIQRVNGQKLLIKVRASLPLGYVV